MLSSTSISAAAPVALSSATLGCMTTLAALGFPWSRSSPIDASLAPTTTTSLDETHVQTSAYTAGMTEDEKQQRNCGGRQPELVLAAAPSIMEIVDLDWHFVLERLYEGDFHDVQDLLRKLMTWGEENVLTRLSESSLGRLHLLASILLVDILFSVFVLRGACRLMQACIGRCCRSCCANSRRRHQPMRAGTDLSNAAEGKEGQEGHQDSDSDSEDPALRSKVSASASTHDGDTASKAPSEESESSLCKGPKAAKRTARELAEVLRQRREGCQEIESVPRDSRATCFSEEKKDFGKGLPCFREDQDLIREAEAAAHQESRRQSGRSRARSEQEVRLWMSQRRTQCAESEAQGRRVVG